MMNLCLCHHFLGFFFRLKSCSKRLLILYPEGPGFSSICSASLSDGVSLVSFLDLNLFQKIFFSYILRGQALVQSVQHLSQMVGMLRFQYFETFNDAYKIIEDNTNVESRRVSGQLQL